MGWIILAVLVVVGLGYVRLAPSDPARWHVAIQGDEDRDTPGGALRVVEGDGARLAQIDAAMRRLTRTRVLAGTPGEGRVTYVTRSRLIGFPDYTTVELRGDQIAIYARLRFGRSDLGVNRARLAAVLGDLSAQP